MEIKKIVIGSDHAGFDEKERARHELEALGVEVEDKGTFSNESVDYPDYAAAVGRAIASGEAERGVLVCGSGIGVAIAANKIPGVRAAVCWNDETARLAREHNDANVICIGSRQVEPSVAAQMIRTFLETDFAGGRHARRVEKIKELEENCLREKGAWKGSA
jgi:ribose 5-phosphate isomerase B